MMFDSEKLRKDLEHFQIDEDGSEVIKNSVLEISIPQFSFKQQIVSGKAKADREHSMSPFHQFHIASITKTMTATLILQLCEIGVFGSKGLDTTLDELPIFSTKVLSRLHNKNNISKGSNITIKQLLTHTSGLKDPYSDDANGIASEYDSGIAPNSIAAQWQSDLEKMGSGDSSFDKKTAIIFKNWIPWDAAQVDNKEAGMLNYYINTLGDSPVALPGEIYHYSDTGFVILALIAEKMSSKSYHRLLRDNIFDPLGMDSTYLAYASDPKPNKWEKEISDCYAGPFPMVTGGFNFSFDWGGGGVVSTASDLNLFLEELIKGALFIKPDTLKEMLDFKTYRGLENSGIKMGLGIFEEKNKKNGIILWGHDGAWGTVLYYEPSKGIYISGTVNQLVGVPAGWLNRLVTLVKSY
ncbi:MAG: hypothetical protein B7C24_07840 [Bacteroidetes bacterium 4572_77]|nr:MAG: hypothetical protein B7C24_07840 [Bacteroidetes bacterium 4572_77]